MTGPHAERRRAIEAALLDFQRAPGRHTLALRQPALLFASVREVLQFAGGRNPGGDSAPPAAAIVRAACFFVRAALLRPGADHYSLLGLACGAPAGAIKERYRSMMRLMHPDFADPAGGNGWPADAATRINQAYEVLSSPERRRAYDEALAGAAPKRVPSETAAPRAPSPAPAARRGHPRRILRHLAAACGALAAIGLATLWAATTSGERDSLVQRAATRAVADKLPSLFGDPTPATDAPGGAPPADAADRLQAVAEPALPTTLAAPLPAASATASTTIALRAPAPASAPASERPELLAAVVPAPSPMLAPTPSPAPSPSPSPAPSPRTAPVVVAAAPPSPVLSSLASAQAAPPVTQAVAQPVAPTVAQPTVAAPRPVSSAPPMSLVHSLGDARPAPQRRSPGPSMGEVHPMLMRLLQEIESGWGDNVIATLDFDSRRSPAAQALARQLDALCDGARPVKIAKADLRGEPQDGRLVVVGQVTLQVRDAAAPLRPFALQAEFAQRGGAAVLVRLAPVSP